MISDSIISTLTYSDHFGFPLTFPELHKRLIGIPISQPKLQQALNLLLLKKKIEKTNAYYHLNGRSGLVSIRQKRQQLSITPTSAANSLARKINMIPGVLAVYLTGSLAMKNSDKHSDIDFMIITQSSRLWSTRLILTLYTTLFGLRRLPGSKSYSGQLCLNLYLTPNSWTIPLSKRSLYTAYELIQAVPLSDPHHLHHQFLSDNDWVTRYLPNFLIPKPTKAHLAEGNKLVSILFQPIEFFAYTIQKIYMSRHITSELITSDLAFFHPHNPGIQVLKKLPNKGLE